MTDKVLHAARELDSFAGDLPRLENALSRRIGADPENVQRGLAQLVLTVVELLRQLMERQALRRVDSGTLSEEQVERLGRTFMELDKRMEELREEFGLDEEDLNLNLGPLGNLL
ncbi:MAG TPA: gas vesicle protein K [Thermoleophilaceae bacterium]|nr:gas vesicle protein K [Thermoleophilaceae bacterium]